MSKLLKFKQALSLEESSSYIHSLTGEKPTESDYLDLLYNGHIYPIIGYRKPLYGFPEEDFIKLKKGEVVSPTAFSNIGIPYELGSEIDDIDFGCATTIDGRIFYFATRNELERNINEELTPLKWLKSLTPSNTKNWSIPTFQIHEIINMVLSNNLPPPKITLPKLTIEFSKVPGLTSNISAINGLQQPIQANLISEKLEKDATEAPLSHKMVIGALLEICKQPRNTARNQSGIISEILERYPRARGLSKRNLEDIFGAANKAMTDIQ